MSSYQVRRRRTGRVLRPITVEDEATGVGADSTVVRGGAILVCADEDPLRPTRITNAAARPRTRSFIVPRSVDRRVDPKLESNPMQRQDLVGPFLQCGPGVAV